MHNKIQEECIAKQRYIIESMEKIPHIIHYCWFGKNPKSELVLKCMESWRKYLPGYEIREWNEENYDVTQVGFVKEAYENQKWAFVSDYVRFDVLYQFGGIYFDTDVELLKPIPEEILAKRAFTGFESTKLISPGLVMGSIKGLDLIAEILEEYQNSSFLVDGRPCYKTVNAYTSEVMGRWGFVTNGEYQEIDGIAVYPAEYFCAVDLDVHEKVITDQTIAVHHYAGSWLQPSLKRKVQNVLKKTIGVENYRKLLHLKRKIVKKADGELG